MISLRRTAQSTLFALAVSTTAGCDWLSYGPFHTCDASKAVDLSEAPAFFGEWNHDLPGGGRRIEIDKKGRLYPNMFGCDEPGMYSMVVGDYNVATAERLQGSGYSRLIYAKITQTSFEFIWESAPSTKSEKPVSEIRIHARIVAPGKMLIKSLGYKEPLLFYKSPEADEEKPTPEDSLSSESSSTEATETGSGSASASSGATERSNDSSSTRGKGKEQ